MEERMPVSDEDKQLLEDIWRLIQELMETNSVEGHSRILDGVSSRRINLYPSDIKGSCHPIAVFLSLRLFKNFGRGWYLDFERIMKVLVQHMQGDECWRVTKKALVYTDDWYAKTYEEWKPNIERMRAEGAKVYFMLVTDNMYTILNA